MSKRYGDFVKRTTAGDEFRKNCERTNDYFKFWDLQTSKQRDWTRPEYYQSRVSKQSATEEKARKEAALNVRKAKLSNMLFDESVAYNEELSNRLSWSDMDDNKLKDKYEKLVAQKKEDRKAEVGRMSRQGSAEIQVETEKAMTEERENITLKELRQTINMEDEQRRKRQEQERLASVNLEDALRKLRENESNIAALISQEATVTKMEQELFSIDQEMLNQEKLRSSLHDSAPTIYGRQIVFQLRKKASEVLLGIEEDKALLERIQKASEQASLSDEAQQQLYLQVSNLLKKMTDQAIREKRVANHNANIFHEEAMNEMKACEQRWLKEKADRKQQLSQILAEWQTHARERREVVTLDRQNLETECKALIELTRMQREAGKAMADLKDTLVQQLGEQGEGQLCKTSPGSASS